MSKDDILVKYSGRFLIFSDKGTYKQTVNFRVNSIQFPELPYSECDFGQSLLDHHIHRINGFNKMRENIRLRNLTLVCMDDNMRFFVFASEPLDIREKKGKDFLLFKLVQIDG
jgi:hypothetical protein